MAESARKSSPLRPQLTALSWSPPSSPPDTSDLDADWSDQPAPRHSYIAMKAPRAKTLPLPPQAPRLQTDATPPAARRSVVPSALLAAEIAYDVWDSQRAMLVLVDLPGVDPDHVSLSLGSHALYLEVNVPSLAPHSGIVSGHHEVTVELPEGLDPEALDASFHDGVLRVRISKLAAGVRHINVSSPPE